MGKAWMPLNNFKKVREDGQKAVLRHPDGHEITLAKSILSPHMKAQLASLQLHKEAPPQKLAKGGRVKAAFGFGSFSPQSFIDNPIGMENPSGPQQQTNQANQMAEEASGQTPGSQPPDQANQFSQPNVNQGGGGYAPVGGMGFGPMPKLGGKPIDKVWDTGYQNQAAGIRGIGQDQQALAYANQAVAMNYLEHSKATADAVARNTQDMVSEYNNFKDDILKNRIDPSQYWNSKSDFQKATTAIGLVLGGIGGGMQGNGQNMALDFLNKQIDRNIRAQVENQGMKKNLLDAGMEMFRNKQLALQFTHTMLLGDMEANFIKQGAASQSALAGDQMKLALGELQQRSASQLYGSQMAMHNSAISVPGPDGRPSGQVVYNFDPKARAATQELVAKYGGALGLLNELQKSYKSGPTADPAVEAHRENLHNGVAAALGQTPTMRNAEVIKRIMAMTDKSTVGKLTGIHADQQFNDARSYIYNELNSAAGAYTPEFRAGQFNPSGGQ